MEFRTWTANLLRRLKRALADVEAHIMTSSGWYPDPTGSPQLRFWDGQTWTASTAPLPGYVPAAPAPPQYAYAGQAAYGSDPVQQQYAPRPADPIPQQSPSPYRPAARGKRFYAVVAGGVAAVLVIAAVVPLALSNDHHHKPPPTSAAFTSVLLTANQVEATAGGAFSVIPGDDDENSDDGNHDKGDSTSASCKTIRDGQPLTKVPTSAQRSFLDQKSRTVAVETLGYFPGRAAAILTAVRTAAATCHTFTDDDPQGTETVTVPQAPDVANSDDTFDMQVLDQMASGAEITVNYVVARFGDSLVLVVYGGNVDPAQANSDSIKLLRQASANAQKVF